MKVLIIGANSQIGDFLLPRLLQRGDRLSAWVRRAPIKAHPINWIHADVYQYAGAEPVDALISAGPLDALPRLLELHAPLGLKQVVAFSSMSATAKAGSAQPDERAQALALQTMEGAVFSTAKRLGLSVAILRPTMIYGCGRDRNLSRLRGVAQRARLILLPASANGLRQPVHASDLAHAAIAALDRRVQGVLELGGAHSLTYREMTERVLRTVPGPVWLQTVPDAIFSRLMAWTKALDRGQIERLNVDQCADLGPAARELGFSPRGFDPQPCDFAPPP